MAGASTLQTVPRSSRLAAWALVAALAVLAVNAPAAPPDAVVVQGFEDLGKVVFAGGKLTPIAAPEAVTEGKQAAGMPPGAAVSAKLQPAALNAAAWVRIDTLATEAMDYPIEVSVEAGRQLSFSAVAYVQPGKDTLALPLSVVLGRARGGTWPEAGVTLTVHNRSAAMLIVDHLRLELAAAAPEGARLLDFGPEGQAAWPGFRATTLGDPMLVWSGENPLRAYAVPMPDPLAGDFVGPILRSNIRDQLQLAVGPAGTAPMHAWLWVTHYAYRYRQPVEAVLAHSVAGRRPQPLVLRRLPPAKLLGPEGLMEGRSGLLPGGGPTPDGWTPKWFDETYAGHFYEVVDLPITNGRARFELANCQIAAAAVAPAPRRAEMARYLEAVRGDIARYRRQFIVGKRIRTTCDLAPTEAEQQSGVMLFQPAGGAGLSPRWTPDEKTPRGRVRLIAYAGGRVIAPVAVVPVRDTAYLGASLGALRTEQGAALRTDGRRLAVGFLKPVPRVRGAQVEFQPWLFAKALPRTSAKRVTFLVLSLGIDCAAQPGTYAGELQVRSTAGPARFPVEIRLYRLPEPPAGRGVWAALDAPDVDDLLAPLGQSLPDTVRARTTLQIRQALMDDTLGALTVEGPRLSSSLNVYSLPLSRDLRTYPTQSGSAGTLLSVQSARRRLALEGVQPGTSDFRNAIAAVVNSAREEAARAKLPGPVRLYIGYCGQTSELPWYARTGAEIRAAGGEPVMAVRSSVLDATAAADRANRLSPFAAIVLVPDSKGVAGHIAEFRKLPAGGKRSAYLLAWRPETYLCGFYARSVGADGCYVYRPVMSNGGPYTGFWVDGEALIMPEPDMALASTWSLFALRQAREDYDLLTRADRLLPEVKRLQLPVQELEDWVRKVRTKAVGLDGVGYDESRLQASVVTAEELDELRTGLIKAVGTVAQWLREGGLDEGG